MAKVTINGMNCMIVVVMSGVEVVAAKTGVATAAVLHAAMDSITKSAVKIFFMFIFPYLHNGQT